MIDRLRVLLEPIVWPIARVFFTPDRAGWLEFINLRAADPDAATIKSTLAVATDWITRAGGNFRDLVQQEVAFVGIGYYSREAISIRRRAWLTPMPNDAYRQPFYVAARLVWIAALIRATHRNDCAAATVARAEAYSVQVSFVRQFPDAAEWEAYIAQQQASDPAMQHAV